MTIDEKLAILRKRWKAEPINRRIIELQARALKMAKEAGTDIVEKAIKIFYEDKDV